MKKLSAKGMKALKVVHLLCAPLIIIMQIALVVYLQPNNV